MKPFSSVKKFYFLDYFYILLRSVEKNSTHAIAFDLFKQLKQEFGLGESKYKKLTISEEALTKVQLDRYKYTFDQVIDESEEYQLVKRRGPEIHLAEKGKLLLNMYDNEGSNAFNLAILQLMEAHFGAFNYLITTLYKVNQHKPGLVIFPIYSPRLLGFTRSEVTRTQDIVLYSQELVKALENDVYKYLGREISLAEENLRIIRRLIDSELLSRDPGEHFDPKKYNVITKRFRDFWITYFLRVLYDLDHSISSFDLWVYRAKQLEILHATEFYPNFNGKLIYPTSIIASTAAPPDFTPIYDYGDKKLFIHQPKGEANQNYFVDTLVEAYLKLRRSYRSYFINLASLRELVCYKMKISEKQFEQFINVIYQLNLADRLKIRISLEVDRLPEETKSAYLKQAPVLVDGRYRNIIAIDITNKVGRHVEISP